MGDTLHPDQYRSLPHALVSFSDDTRVSYDRLGELAGVALHAQVIAPSYHALPGLIVGTDRVATLQMRLAERLAGLVFDRRPPR